MTSVRVVGYLPGCYPDEETYRRALSIAYGAGIRLIEIGIPGAVPPLEGSTITSALEAVTAAGLDEETVVTRGTKAAAAAGLSPVPMAYRGTVFETIGLERFLRLAADNGARAVLVPDATADERRSLVAAADATGVGVVPFIPAGEANGTPVPADSAFAYVQTAPVPTGGEFSPDPALPERIAAVRGRAPVALGFGIRTPDQVARALSLGADLVVVGTAMVDALNAGPAAFEAYVASIAEAGRSEV